MSTVLDQSWSGRHLLITQRLRHRRDELGLTQKQVVSRLARVGVMTTNRALSSLEHGAGLDVAKLPELAHVLDCTVTYLVGLTDDPRSWVPDPELAALRPAVPVAAAPARAGAAARPSCILGANVPDRPRRPG
jgi:transcriptional regulator with XRE-family HTH domain